MPEEPGARRTRSTSKPSREEIRTYKIAEIRYLLDAFATLHGDTANVKKQRAELRRLILRKLRERKLL